MPRAPGPSRGAPGTRRRELGVHERLGAHDHLAGGAVQRDHLPLAHDRAGRPGRDGCSSSTTTSPAPTTQHLPQPARHHRRVRGEAAARGERCPAPRACPPRPPARSPARTRMTCLFPGAISTAFSGSNTTLPTAAAGRGRQARGRWRCPVAVGSTVFTRSCRATGRLAAFRPPGGRHRAGARCAGRSTVARCTMSTAMRTAAAAGALAGARLQDVERALLHRELDVLHVAVVALEPVLDRDELVVDRRHPLLERVDRLAGCGCPPPRPRPGR